MKRIKKAKHQENNLILEQLIGFVDILLLMFVPHLAKAIAMHADNSQVERTKQSSMDLARSL